MFLGIINLALVFLPNIGEADNTLRFTTIGNLALSCYKVFVQDDYAYILSSDSTYLNSLRVIDLSNPSVPAEVGKWEIQYDPRLDGIISYHDIKVADNYAYISTKWGLYIIDISKPSEPFETNHYINPDHYDADYIDYKIDVSDQYLYAGFDDGLHVVDVSTPSAPVILGHCHISAAVDGIEVVRSYAYILYMYGLKVIDVSNPKKPISTGFLRVETGSGEEIHVSGNYAYSVSGYDNHMDIIDVSKPSSPTLIKRYEFSSDIANNVNFAIKDNYAYLCNGENGLAVVDVTKPSDPVEIYRDTSLVVYDICAVGDIIYIAGDTTGLWILRKSKE